VTSASFHPLRVRSSTADSSSASFKGAPEPLKRPVTL
jgi:hypothetical protein